MQWVCLRGAVTAPGAAVEVAGGVVVLVEELRLSQQLASHCVGEKVRELDLSAIARAEEICNVLFTEEVFEGTLSQGSGAVTHGRASIGYQGAPVPARLVCALPVSRSAAKFALWGPIVSH